VHGGVLYASITGEGLPPAIVGIGLSALIGVMGNRMGKVRQNFFLGIRTPWTLVDPEVWVRTHRLAGKLMVGAALISLFLSLTGASMLIVLPLVLFSVLAPAAYSYLLYRKLNSHPPTTGPQTP
jgi:uncharacterized membrane protein